MSHPLATTLDCGQFHNRRRISFVIPVMNEEDTLDELVDGILAQVDDHRLDIIFIDDGSTDTSWSVIESLSEAFPNIIRGVRFRKNRGKAAALQVGFELAQGDLIFTMDADLQDDPQEIPRFIQKIDEGFDLVSGWKAKRHDPWHKVLPSRVFNRIISYVSDVELHDHNCGFKCYRREVAKSIKLFGELHRMVPALAGDQGYRVTEIVVTHHPRRFGKSKYGIERFLRGLSDIVTVGFLNAYRERPSHFANTLAGFYFATGLILAGCSFFSGLGSLAAVIGVLGGLCFLGMSGACVLVGLLGELMIRQQHTQSDLVTVDTHESNAVGNGIHHEYEATGDDHQDVLLFV